MLLNNVLTVDTGLTTAWARWNGSAFPNVGHFICPRKLSQVERIAKMSERFETILHLYKPEKVILEMVELWEGSLKSKTSAVRGDTFGLALLIGAYIRIAQEYSAEVELLTAREWKGQLSKEATVFRVKAINGLTYESEHITDAVGMGFSRDSAVWHLKKTLGEGDFEIRYENKQNKKINKKARWTR